ncbi:MAG: TIGR02186 family protein [Pseudorhodoplanes sp.]
MMRRAAILSLILFAGIPCARAERLVTSLSTHQVMITQNFTGVEIVLFGSVERDAATVSRRGGYDVAVTVSGPRQEIVTSKKERRFLIWMNAQSRALVAPGYLAVLTNRPTAAMATPDLMQRMQVGIENIGAYRNGAPPRSLAALPPDDPFRDAFLRLKKEQGLYREVPDGVTFLSPTLFRANIPLPANAPLGTYEVDVKLFVDGTNIARATSALEIVKVGFEQYIANAARDHGFLYGLATAMMALCTGWLASIVFRRD